MVLVLLVASVPAGMAAAATPTGPADGAGVAAAQETTETATANSTESDADGDGDAAEGEDASSGGIAPGAQLAGVLAVQRAEIDSELDSRSFEAQVTSAKTNRSKARVVSNHVNQTQTRLDDLRSRLAELKSARRDGNLSQGRYRAQAAHLAAEIRSLQRLVDQTRDVAVELSPEARQSSGIDEARFERLRNDTQNLSGSEVSEIAREVAGSNVGNGLARGVDEDRRGERGPPDRAEGESESPGNAGNATARGDGNESAAPGRSENAPGRDDGNESELPGNSGDAPGRDDGNESAAPGNSGDAPGRDDDVQTDVSRPGESGPGAPDESGDAPGRSADAPGRSDAANRSDGNSTDTAADTETTTGTETTTETDATADSETATETDTTGDAEPTVDSPTATTVEADDETVTDTKPATSAETVTDTTRTATDGTFSTFVAVNVV
ncbi:hypothetical protein SAMN04487947_2133 [Halogeometricum rufum]|uniref:DUF7096 domain-containing protein n=2 Tax=Halogeometricum rufum TaxID=553469 RepID=A0A1I6HJ57_9EURY|nr:hypothetical protein SAMN04487947_2133 [Halogeometricum rufum]